jgi:hypothetical protein
MRDVGHAMAALLIQVETGQLVSLGQGRSLDRYRACSGDFVLV